MSKNYDRELEKNREALKNSFDMINENIAEKRSRQLWQQGLVESNGQKVRYDTCVCGVVSLVCGVLSIPLCLLYVPAIIGLIFAIVSLVKETKKVPATIGLILNTVGLLIPVILVILMLS